MHTMNEQFKPLVNGDMVLGAIALDGAFLASFIVVSDHNSAHDSEQTHVQHLQHTIAGLQNAEATLGIGANNDPRLAARIHTKEASLHQEIAVSSHAHHPYIPTGEKIAGGLAVAAVVAVAVGLASSYTRRWLYNLRSQEDRRDTLFQNLASELTTGLTHEEPNWWG
jgi:hypothetical protein